MTSSTALHHASIGRYAPVLRKLGRMTALGGGGLWIAACSAGAPTDSGGGASSLEMGAGDVESTPIYSYADAVRESIWVDTPLDDDGDGVPDKVAVDIVRPREAAQQGIKVPVILEASPYYQSIGRGNESQVKAYDANGVISDMPLFYDNYFVPRGYAFVSVDLAGTNRSKGCIDVGSREDILSAKAVIDWLNGRATASRADGTRVVADWTDGKVGMIGKSWDGTVANGVAATGVEGLVTIVPISSISSWYLYTRHDGVLAGDDRFGFLANVVNGRPEGICAPETASLQKSQDDATGNFNDFFEERDYLPSVNKVHASVFVVHGLDDWNVQTPQFARWWNALGERGVPRKIWLSHEAHVDPFDLRRAEWVSTLHHWFDHWLQGRHNGIMNEPMATIERHPDTWVDEPTWPAASASRISLPLGAGDGTTGTIGRNVPNAPNAKDGQDIRTFTDDPNQTEQTAVANPNAAQGGRLVFLSRALGNDVRISGSPAVDLRVRVNAPTTELTARIIDYGSAQRVHDYIDANAGGVFNLSTQSCWGGSTSTDSACYFDTAHDLRATDFGVIARGWLDAAHRNSLTAPTPLEPSRYYHVRIPIAATDSVIPKGHVLGLVVTASDDELTAPHATGATIDVDLSTSSVTLPLVECAGEALATTMAPQVHAPLPAGAFVTRQLDKRSIWAKFF